MRMFIILPEAKECWNLRSNYLTGKDLLANSHYEREREKGLVALDYV